ncbi:HAD-IC family P-type ATPase [Helicobacter saguini]|uniref:P-type Zn(2+) transporter n=1 Tax=Helicobacter saguini TaxID=1548018 RepID=A0A347W698_9HELI|nr:heavy metal translocating P-type ATPase [Helicobacter saguini]MWV61098.1 HAD-IC family P-type ATPase [Helicobacter saguini]MWV68233.1 HAD-IC family P-type ATPase [Helicobacter saguini]MWV70303.1 HAD-IC family P-type ATPase [Helicobacter saguini]MWV72205.1 HAD-IC family P-type ATPase [Helicobacter saguini]TLD95258.1 heavy metal translocating P-type ATPase [Helicobacter saguini]
MQKFRINNLSCAGCAAKLESALAKMPSVASVSVNFSTNTLSIDTQDLESVKEKIKKLEPNAKLENLEQNIESNAKNTNFIESNLLDSNVDSKFNNLNKEKLESNLQKDSKNIIESITFFIKKFKEDSIKKEGILLSFLLIIFLVMLSFEYLPFFKSYKFHNFVYFNITILSILYVIAGLPVFRASFQNIKNKEIFDENLLMCVATIAAFCIGEISEAVAVMLFFRMGEFLESISTNKAKKSISNLLSIMPQIAHVKVKEDSKKLGNLQDSNHKNTESSLKDSINSRNLQAFQPALDSKSHPFPPTEKLRQPKMLANFKTDSKKLGNLEQNIQNTWQDTNPQNLQIGDLILIKAGESVPADCVILQGESHLDMSALNGESVPKSVKPTEQILAGSINLSHALIAKVTQKFHNSQLSKIKEMVENASDSKPKTQKIITKFAKIYTPIMFFIALIVAIVPPFLTLYFDVRLDSILSLDFLTNNNISTLESNLNVTQDSNTTSQIWHEWIYRALVILMVSCPCALVLSVPLGYFGALGIASKKGILIKGSNFLESLANVKNVVFDKTGTLTNGRFSIAKIVCSAGFSDDILLQSAICAEQFSSHPIARAFLDFSNEKLKDLKRHNCDILKHEERGGQGVLVTCKGDCIIVGTLQLLKSQNIDVSSFSKLSASLESSEMETCTIVHIAKNGVYAGFVLIADSLKPDTLGVMNDLRGLNIEPYAILSGDNAKSVGYIASLLGIKRFFANLLPTQKAEILKELMYNKSYENTNFLSQEKDSIKLENLEQNKEKIDISHSLNMTKNTESNPKDSIKSSKNPNFNPHTITAFVGDGINDSIVLATSDVGISVSGQDSNNDISKQSADVILTNPSLKGVVAAIKIARKIKKITYQNIVFVLLVKLIIIALGLFGIANMWLAVFGDVGVALLTLLNALRVLRI